MIRLNFSHAKSVTVRAAVLSVPLLSGFAAADDAFPPTPTLPGFALPAETASPIPSVPSIWGGDASGERLGSPPRTPMGHFEPLPVDGPEAGVGGGGLGAAAGEPVPAITLQKRAELKLRGLDSREVELKLGPPDTRRGGGAREEWVYGRSLVFFADGHVSSWSDVGDLEERASLAAVRAGVGAPGGKAEEKRERWVNPWTPSTRSAKGEVLDELLNGRKKR